MDNADKTKYGTLLSHLSEQHSLKNTQYPKTVVDANNVLSNHRFDPKYKELRQRRSSQQQHSRERQEADADEIPELSFMEIENKCYCCGKPGHKSTQCRYKNKPKPEWAINKVKEKKELQNLLLSRTGAATSSATSPAASHAQATTIEGNNEQEIQLPTWMAVQVECTAVNSSQEATSPNPISLAQGSSMRDWILLDSQSSISLFCSPALVKNITDGKKKMVISTNAGDLTSTQQAEVPGFGQVWYNENAMTNIYSLCDMVDRFRVTFDSEKEDAIVVHTPQGPLKLHRNHQNLYSAHPQIHRPNIRIRAARAATANIFLEAVEHNSSFCTQLKFERAKTARRLLLGFPTTRDLKTIITSNAIRNCPVTC
jgi:hypothetical protein